MKIVRKNQTKIVQNNNECIAIEYGLHDKDINGAIVELKGRYPKRGRTVNEKCKELAFVMAGQGKLVVENTEFELEAEDLILINPGERFYWEGNMRIFMPCTPAWYPQQHKEVK